MDNQKEVIKGELSEQELKDLVAKYPKCTTAIFRNGDGELVAVYLKKVEREIFVQGNKFLNQKDEITTAEFLLKNLRIAGVSSEEIIKDFDSLKNCAATIIPVLYVVAGELKKN